MKLRERFWLWGHPEGRYNHEYGNDRESRMTPMEGCLYLGIANTFMVPVGRKVDHRQYNKSFKTLRHVGWECFTAGEKPEILEPLIAEAAELDEAVIAKAKEQEITLLRSPKSAYVLCVELGKLLA